MFHDLLFIHTILIGEHPSLIKLSVILFPELLHVHLQDRKLGTLRKKYYTYSHINIFSPWNKLHKYLIFF